MAEQRYLCERPCFHNGVFYQIGQVAVFDDDYPKDRGGSLRHFVEIGGVEEEAADDAGSGNMTVKDILAKLAGLGVDPGTAKKKDELLALLNEAQKGDR